ncbi:2-keto-4-pentenoate hydratase/2-oxohepta-3-ene-1,7-dioic acid hydratase (catechol pathway) [Candidatus Thermokryptus mobilis]|uniref:2-keto-4-pentenoate hydratase/2-oxohepta-3-ene-1,7-dioic acid hydratase (Catechol pathway) n=1 Tax=Candidatus Thermokryptus mobilis TaxID=1643428 RepID=A0A0S4MS96_9BACT|nr:fumarylacetoacetate hydrolase family protein [Candidatus Thermokryptus mobilis]CUU00609.1 2-keto-4-pentenoate hydratase/2-oxohepta-3-ene-1,7-dioic acid hydratase (catechol pathway) [Candidatus Thermokryptus mobilis]
MKVLSLRTEREGFIGLIYDESGRILNLTDALPLYQKLKNKIDDFPKIKTVTELFREQLFNIDLFKRVVDFVDKHNLMEYLFVKESFRYNAPVEYPPKLICLGRNYELHAREFGSSAPEGEPIIFAKSSTSVVGHLETIYLPSEVGRIDHEIELAVVIGKRGKKIRRENAWNYIVGYTIMIDVTARDLQRKDIELKYPWFRSKSFDYFAPMGPWIVTADEIQPPVELDLKLWVNDELRQNSNTRNMIFDIPTIIESISKYITLYPGDVISTGTPEGVGPIKPGDKITAWIQNIGELVNYVEMEVD